jgi:hypothetical protein
LTQLGSDPELVPPEKYAAFKLMRAKLDLVPDKSKRSYVNEYRNFMGWIQENNLVVNADSCLLWLNAMKPAYKTSSLYSKWSKIKKLLCILHDLNADSWHVIKLWLKSNSRGLEQKPVQAAVFTVSQVQTFLVGGFGAGGEEYSRERLALIFGLFGRLRAIDYTQLFHSNIKVLKSLVFIYF